MTSDDSDYTPDFIEIEFEEWFFAYYNAVPRDRRRWGVAFTDRYDDARRAWIAAFKRGLEVNY